MTECDKGGGGVRRFVTYKISLVHKKNFFCHLIFKIFQKFKYFKTFEPFKCVRNKI